MTMVRRAVGFSLGLHFSIIMTLLSFKSAETIHPPVVAINIEMAEVPSATLPPMELPPSPETTTEPIPQTPQEPIPAATESHQEESVLPPERPLPLPPEPRETALPRPKKKVTAGKSIKTPRKPSPRPVSENLPQVEESPPSATAQTKTDAITSVPTAPRLDSYRPPDVKAAYANNPKPIYPPSARRMGQEGTVLLLVDVTEAGLVARATVKTSSGFDSMDRAALAAVSQWRFIPAQRNSIPVPVSITLPIRFQLQNE